MGRILGWVFLAAMMAFLVFPVLVVVPMSFSTGVYLAFPPREFGLQNFRNIAEMPEWRGALAFSFQVAVIVTLIAVPVGTAAASALDHMSARRQAVWRLVVLVPLIIPLILMGFALYVVYAYLGLLNRMPSLVLAHLALAIPYVALAVGVGIRGLDWAGYRAARVCGALPARAFRDTILPQLTPSLGAGALFAFVASFDEAVIALFITSGTNSPITRRVFTSLRDRIDPTVSAVSTVLLAVTLLLLLAAVLRDRKRASA